LEKLKSISLPVRLSILVNGVDHHCVAERKIREFCSPDLRLRRCLKPGSDLRPIPPFACFLSLFYGTRVVLVAPTQLLPFLFIPMSGSA
jgi:hypothetical protein